MKSKNNAKVPWSISDIIIVFLLIFLSAAIIFLFLKSTSSDEAAVFSLFSIFYSLYTLAVIYLWLKIRYKISLKDLGIKVGKYKIRNQFVLGVLVALCYLFILWICPFWHEIAFHQVSGFRKSLVVIIGTLFTMTGFSTFILTPVGEEILLRGFLYRYLRKKMGLLLGLFIQSSIASIMHFSSLLGYLEIGHVFGYLSYIFFFNIIVAMLYEFSESLYSSIFCHAVFNYILFLY